MCFFEFALRRTPVEAQVRAGTDMPHGMVPPGPERMRGGAARHLASAWLFHRGIHLESTLASLARIIIQDQGLKRSPFWLKWILFGIRRFL